MLTLRPTDARGQTHLSWLTSKHSFSFGDYMDPKHVQFGPLRVINEDWIAPDSGFGFHSHRDMEIITVVLAGEVLHRDNLNNEEVIGAGEVQVMTAGRGITHSEWNPSPDTELHLLQIWITPHTSGLPPGYEQRRLSLNPGATETVVLASGREGMNPEEALYIHQDVTLSQVNILPDDTLTLTPEAGRSYWFQAIQGEVRLSADKVVLKAGDGSSWQGQNAAPLTFTAGSAGGSLLVFDLPEVKD